MTKTPIIIDSPQNSQLQKLLKLQKSQTKNSVAEFVIDGDHFCQLANREKKLLSLWMTPPVFEKLTWTPAPHVKIYLVSPRVVQKISQVKHSSGIIGVCQKPRLRLETNHNLLIIDRLQDPGNLGTLMRSAAAFNFLTIVVSSDTVSFYNPKVLRATQGLIFKLNLLTTNDLKSFLVSIKQQNYQVIGTFLHTDLPSIPTFKTVNQRQALLIGNEGQGLEPHWLSFIDYNFVIDMNPEVESLNAAVAGSIIMYQLSQN